MNTHARGIFAGLVLATLSACQVSQPLTGTKLEGCVSGPSTNGFTYCEIRNFPDLATRGTAKIRSTNGSVTATGSARSTITLDALIRTRAATEARAKEIAAQIVINTSNDDFFATGPVAVSPESWGVSFEAQTPAPMNLDTTASNGGMRLTGLEGQIAASAINGDMVLETLAGKVSAETTNGSIEILLSGEAWAGEGLSAESGNGAVIFRVPSSYSARFTLDAQNGSTESDFPGGTTTQTSPTDSHYEVTLGSGGALLTGAAQNGNAELRRQ